MAERLNPSRGGKPDKLIRDALMLALKREHEVDGHTSSKINAIAAKLVEMAVEGNVQASSLIADRVDGKAMQAVEVKHDGEITLKSAVVSQLDSFFAVAAGRLEDQSDTDVVPN